MSSNAMNDGIRIGYYENWMFDQVIDLFVIQYGLDRDQQRTFFRRFYETPFQLSQGIRLVALDGEIVCGFQSYFYWPYHYQGRALRTFQSGNSLVSPNYRGRQLFARLLSFLVEGDILDKHKIDFLTGFPVKMSYGSFIRNKWVNPLDLIWYVKLIHPLSVVRAYKPERSDWDFETTSEPVEAFYSDRQILLAKDSEFSKWRYTCRQGGAHYIYLHYYDSNGTIRFELKPNRRGRINELVLGDIVRTSPNLDLLRAGLRALLRAAKGCSFLTILSFALNEKSVDRSFIEAVNGYGFFKLKNRIPFIVKPIGDFPECTNPSLWNPLRSDMDTW